MYPLNLGDEFEIQQRIVGGTFTGADYGRASVTLSAFAGGTSQLRVKSRRYGVSSNVYSIQLVDQGSGVTVSLTTVQLVGSAIKVTLRRDSVTGILATPQEVADAINAVTDYEFPVRAEIVGSGSPLASAVSATLLTGGLDPSVSGNNKVFLWDSGSTPQGFFHFENDFDSVIITQISFEFTSPPSADVVVYRMDLTSAYSPIASRTTKELVRPITGSTPDFSLSNWNLVVLPQQAIQVVFNAGGFVRIVGRKRGRFPYL